jgi:hypothetical protein
VSPSPSVSSPAPPLPEDADLAGRITIVDMAVPIDVVPDLSAPDLASPIVPSPPPDLASPDLTSPVVVVPVLTASIDPSTDTPIDQTTGMLDWAHWGLTDRNSFDHKLGGALGNFVNLQGTNVRQLGGYPIGFSWSDGDPRVTASNTTTGVYTHGQGAGFRITVAADTTLHTLKLYGGGQQSTVQVTASLSDGSAPDAVQSTSDTLNFQRVVTVTYRAATPCTLTLDWAVASQSGFVHIQSVTVQ